jgi:hypothetical protein
MSRARRYRIVGVLLALLLGGFITLAACSNYGEGERCQAENGNDDCQDGLVCLAASQKGFNGGTGTVNPPFNTSDRCCPPDRSTATHPACTLLTGSITGQDSAPPGDTGPEADAPVADSPTDTNTLPDVADANADADGD